MNVTLIDFRGPLENLIELVQSSSLFMGMHGAVSPLDLSSSERDTNEVMKKN